MGFSAVDVINFLGDREASVGWNPEMFQPSFTSVVITHALGNGQSYVGQYARDKNQCQVPQAAMLLAVSVTLDSPDGAFHAEIPTVLAATSLDLADVFRPNAYPTDLGYTDGGGTAALPTDVEAFAAEASGQPRDDGQVRYLADADGMASVEIQIVYEGHDALPQVEVAQGFMDL